MPTADISRARQTNGHDFHALILYFVDCASCYDSW